MTTGPMKHCAWLKKTEKPGKEPAVSGNDRDRYGASRKKSATGIEKVNCPVRLTADYLKNGMVTIRYKWTHCNHDPTSIDEIVSNKLPDDVRQQIFEKVSLNMDWKSIKSVLHLDEDSLNE
ncbi:hypothetical protein ABG067_009222, partial [Albugo candida]